MNSLNKVWNNSLEIQVFSEGSSPIISNTFQPNCLLSQVFPRVDCISLHSPLRNGLRFAKRSLAWNELSLCHTKRRTGTRGHACPSFDMTLTFFGKFFFLNFFIFLFIYFFFKAVVKPKEGQARQKKGPMAMRAGPSFGITTTQDIRDLFV